MRKADILFVETFPNLVRNTNANIRVTLKSPNMNTRKLTPRYLITNMLMLEEKY